MKKLQIVSKDTILDKDILNCDTLSDMQNIIKSIIEDNILLEKYEFIIFYEHSYDIVNNSTLNNYKNNSIFVVLDEHTDGIIFFYSDIESFRMYQNIYIETFYNDNTFAIINKLCNLNNLKFKLIKENRNTKNNSYFEYSKWISKELDIKIKTSNYDKSPCS